MKAKFEKYLEEIWKDLALSEETLDDAVRKQASLFLFYGLKWVRASRKVLLEKANLEEYTAKLKNELRQKLVEEGNGKRVTEKYLDELVLQDTGYRECLERYIEAKEEELFWEVVKSAFKQKKDMIEAMVNLMLASRWTDDKVKLDAFTDVIKRELRQKRERVDSYEKDNS